MVFSRFFNSSFQSTCWLHLQSICCPHQDICYYTLCYLQCAQGTHLFPNIQLTAISNALLPKAYIHFRSMFRLSILKWILKRKKSLFGFHFFFF